MLPKPSREGLGKEGEIFDVDNTAGGADTPAATSAAAVARAGSAVSSAAGSIVSRRNSRLTGHLWRTGISARLTPMHDASCIYNFQRLGSVTTTTVIARCAAVMRASAAAGLTTAAPSANPTHLCAR